jgi:2-methylcitrate dehydratase PrpD
MLTAYIEQRRGSIDHPLSAIEITQKFRRLAETSRSEAEIDELIETVSRLETQPGLLRLVQLITMLRDQ